MFFLTKTLLGAFFALPLIVNGKCVTLVDEMGQRYPLTINEKQLEGAIEEISLYTNTDQDATLPISLLQTKKLSYIHKKATVIIMLK